MSFDGLPGQGPPAGAPLAQPDAVAPALAVEGQGLPALGELVHLRRAAGRRGRRLPGRAPRR